MQRAKSAPPAYLAIVLIGAFFVVLTFFHQPAAETKCLLLDENDRCLDSGKMTSTEQQQDHPQSDLVISSTTNYSSLILVAVTSAILIGTIVAVLATRRQNSSVFKV